MSDLENNAYQRNFTEEKVQPLTDFLNGVRRKKGFKVEFEPYSKQDGHRYTLTSVLKHLQEDKVGVPVEKEDSGQGDVIDGLYLGANQRYFMGASSEPPMVVTSKVDDDKVYYFTFPFKKEQALKKDIAADLFQTGSQTWLESEKSSHDQDLKESISAVLNGEPGEEVSIDDYQYSTVQVKYNGPTEGDLAPWKELEDSFDVQVDNVLTNKQIYNLRMNNRELQRFEDAIQDEDSNFEIIKTMKEEREYMIEASNTKKLKTDRMEITQDEAAAWIELLQTNKTQNFSAEDWSAGEPVIWDDNNWFIVDFVPSGEDMTAILLDTENKEVANFVPLEKLEKYAPENFETKDKKDTKKTPKKDKKDDKEEIGKEVEWKDGEAKVKGEEKKEKKKELDFPESDPSGETQEQKPLKEEVIPSGKVKQLIDCIQNDPTLGGQDGRLQVIVENLIRKYKQGKYDSNLAVKAFETLVDRGARKCSKAPDASFPRMVRQRTAEALKDQFENNVKMGHYEEETNEKIIQKHIQKLIEEADKSLEEAVKDEAKAFTEKEKEELKKWENVDLDTENMAVFAWNAGGKNYRLEITKKPRPATNDFVYEAVSTFNNNQLDKERTIDSDPFKTEDDINVLKNFLTELNINEDEECPDTTGEADKKKVTAKDVHPEELMMGIKVEMEHTQDKELAKQIALDHLAELPDYYSRLKKMEKEGEEDLNEEEDKKDKKKKEPQGKKVKHTETKWVNSLPTKDGKKVRSEVQGDVRIIYKTFEEKRKKDIEKKAKGKKKKGE
jgi:hypothetical protein